MLSWAAVQLERGAIERDLETRSRAELDFAGHEWAGVAFSGRDGLLVGHPGNLEVGEDAAALVRNVWGVHTVETRFAGAPAAETPARDEPHIVPLPRHKPPALIVAARSPTPVAVPSSEHHAALAPLENNEHVALAATPPPATHEIASQPPADAVLAHDDDEAAAHPPAPSAPLAETPSSQPQTSAIAETHPPAATAPAPVAPATTDPHPSAPVTPAPVPDAAPAAETAPAPAAAAVSGPEAPPAAPAQAGPPVATPTPAPPADEAAARTPPPLPEPKTSEPLGVPPVPSPKALETDQPPLPARNPRFETAALPPGNIAPDAACLGDVRLAATGVEVHFGRGDAKLDAAGKGVIDKLVGALGACPQAALRISGHTDATGQRHRNLALSRHRARTVVRYIANKGIDGGRLAAVGYGETRPVAPNDTGANRARNRRIEVVITARAGSLPPMPVRKQGTRNGLSRR